MVLHHDNASAHTELSMKHFLAQKLITVPGHPLYLPVPAPRGFFPLKFDSVLKGIWLL